MAATTLTIATYGALIGLAIAIALIIFKLHPVYALIIGALVGGIIGLIGQDGATFNNVFSTTINAMIDGGKSMISPILRILCSGILAGALIMTGSAEKIATVITKKLGDRFSLIAIAISTMIICTVGVFIDISVITVAPIAISIAKKTKLPKSAILLSMIGGGKAGNIISPNPNTIATADNFGIDLSSLIIRNIVPAIFALIVTILLAFLLKHKCSDYIEEDKKRVTKTKKIEEKKLPHFLLAILGPLVVIVILVLRPTANVNIDPLIALPVGGVVTIIVTGNAKKIIDITSFGLSKVIGIAILLLGTGALAGVISASALKTDIGNMLNAMNMPLFLLAPISGFFFAAATASTTSGSSVASSVFAKTLVDGGVSAVGGAAMMHASATILDSLPHGSFFHATGGSVEMDFKSRLKIIPFEALVGLTSTIASIIVYLIIK